MNTSSSEFWWLLERWSGKVWRRFCPSDRASYWLDFLPAFCGRQRYSAENRCRAGGQT